MEHYRILGRIGEGAHGIVMKAKHIEVATDELVALKKIPLRKLVDGIPNTALRAIGCIFGELFNNSPIFPGENDIEQLWFVIRILGTPQEDSWLELKDLPDYNKITFNTCEPKPFEEVLPDAPPEAVDLIKRFLTYPPHERISCTKALLHHYFTVEPPPAHPSQLPRPCPRRAGSNMSMAHPQQTYDSCLHAPLKSLVVSHKQLRDGVQCLRNSSSTFNPPETYSVPCTSPLQVAIPLSTVKR
ncbi:cell cycle related kinase [Paragonimus westermani]|uniref:Cyclin-dependent kinase 20 n=1 Tax=Paragonimus westermani TaxID=34504 RepID=A0A5J4NTX4_9TREM|nr:cell cycle related kinase [Paragonimus westermani]